MQISFNPASITGSLIENNVANSKVDFVNRYGSYSAKYDDLTPLGGQKKTWFYFIIVISLIIMGILFNISKEKKDENGNVIPPTSNEKIYKILAWIFLGIAIIFIIYSGYMYFFIYSPQYKEWFRNLPVEAQNKLNVIKSLTVISNEVQNFNKNNPSLIKIN
jgi:hypothetical protein